MLLKISNNITLFMDQKLTAPPSQRAGSEPLAKPGRTWRGPRGPHKRCPLAEDGAVRSKTWGYPKDHPVMDCHFRIETTMMTWWAPHDIHDLTETLRKALTIILYSAIVEGRLEISMKCCLQKTRRNWSPAFTKHVFCGKPNAIMPPKHPQSSP